MKLFFSILVLSISISAFAQKDTNIVVNLPHKSYDKKHKKPSGEENTIKIAPLGFVSGIYPVYCEHVINDFFTIQAGIGITGRNYYRNLIQTIDDQSIVPNYPWGDNNNIKDLADAALVMKNRKSVFGYLFSIQPRIYFDSDAPNDGFMGISYDIYRYNFNIPGIDSITHQVNGPLQKEHETISDAMVSFGYQNVMDRISVEYSIGLGIRNVKGIKYYFSDTNSSEFDRQGFAPYKQTLFNFNLGLKVGYHF